jgi:hypothetical protein
MQLCSPCNTDVFVSTSTVQGILKESDGIMMSRGNLVCTIPWLLHAGQLGRALLMAVKSTLTGTSWQPAM